MRHDLGTLLEDIRAAAGEILLFTEGVTVDQYRNNALLRRAVERDFMILGEALARARQLAPEIVTHISSAREIIGFRNHLVHGYETIRDETVWAAVEQNLPILLSEITQLLAQRWPPPLTT